jgi:flagellar biosynthesis component FlhA
MYVDGLPDQREFLTFAVSLYYGGCSVKKQHGKKKKEKKKKKKKKKKEKKKREEEEEKKKKKKKKKKKEKNGSKPATFLKTGNGSARDLFTCRKILKAAIKRDKIELISRKEFSFSKYQNLCTLELYNLLIANF